MHFAQEFKKNLQAFGNNTLGSYTIDGYYGNGYGESVWSLLLLNEELNKCLKKEKLLEAKEENQIISQTRNKTNSSNPF